MSDKHPQELCTEATRDFDRQVEGDTLVVDT